MKTLSLWLAAVLPLAMLGVVQAQTPTPDQVQQIQSDVQKLAADVDALATGCGCKGNVNSDDAADMAEAVARGFGHRLAIGPYREATLAVREWRASDNNDLPKLQARLNRTPRFTACQKATMAVIALEMVNSFSPGTIPPQVLAIAIQVQQAACATPAQGVPTRAKPKTAPATNWLSTQFVLDSCGGANGGCSGDDNTTVLANAKTMGIPLESDYGPYVAYNQGCQAMTGTPMLYTLSDWGYADPSTTDVGATALIKAAILKYNGVGCAVAADNAFMNYSGGVFNGRSTGINHDVFLAGWDDAKSAWLMVNSWGPWGIDPTTGKAVKGKFTAKTGLVLKPATVRALHHATFRQRSTKAVADLAQLAENLPASYSCIATQPPIADQQSCGSCWDFSGVRVVSAANILSGTLPKSAPMTSGCMWIKYGANQIGTEAVYGIGGKPVPYVAPPGPGPQPQPTPTRRAAVLGEKGSALYATGDKAKQATVLKAIKAAEDVLSTAN